MYYNTVYARCANGYDLEKRTEKHDSGGYKVHGFSREILNDGKVDIPYLVSILQKTIPADKDELKDDGFFYSAADSGSRFLTRFHYVTDAFRNFFITQAYVGQYEELYPFELFGREDLWDAKDKNEEYYLSAETAYYPAVARIEKPEAGTIRQEAIRFIEDGRKPVFKQALAFIISQYGLPASQRKYLVIRDKSEKEIEYWIAALSMAVSPRMASELTFATRMEAIQNTNRYGVDKNGRYTKGMDFQSDPNSLRRIAMIVGAVDPDRENAGITVKQNSPYVLLDGAKLTLSETVDDSHKYYASAADFSEGMSSFCRIFVQAFGYTSPTKEILELYRLYSILWGDVSDSAYALALKETLSKPIVKKENLKWLYERTKKRLSEGEHRDVETLISLSDGLKQISALFGCSEEKEIEERILGSFDTVLFKGTNQERDRWWSTLRRSQFASAAAARFTRSDAFGRSEPELNRMAAADLAKVIEIYADMQSANGTRDNSLTETLCSDLFGKCRLAADKKTAGETIARVDRVYENKAAEIWNGIIRKNDSTSTFLLDVMYPEDGTFPEDVSKMIGTCARLHQNGDKKLAERIVTRAIKNAETLDQIKEVIIKLKKEGPLFKDIDKDAYYKLIDARLDFRMKDRSLPRMIQAEKPEKTVCVKSAHIMALDKLQNMRRNDTVEEQLKPYFEQGFPSMDIPNFINELCTTMIRNKLSEADAECLVKRMVEAKTDVYYRTLFAMLYEYSAKKADLWSTAVSVAASEKKKQQADNAFNAMVDVLYQQKASKGAMEKAGKYIESESAWKFYMAAVEKALDRRAAEKPKGGGLFGSLFGKRSD